MNLEPQVQIALIFAVTVLILVAVFRDRILELTFSKEGAGLKLRDPDGDAEARSKAEQEIEKEAVKSQIDWQKSGDIFWLGNDLMWTKAAVYSGRSKAAITKGLENAIERAEALGFSGTYAVEKMRKLIQYVDSVPTFDRNDLANQIETVKQYIASRAEGRQSESED